MENKIEKLKEEFEEIKKEIAGTGFVKKGSITRCYQFCRNPNCRCNKNPRFRHGPYFLLTLKERAKIKTFSVTEGMLSEVKSYVKNYKILKSKIMLLEEISEKIIKIKIKNIIFLTQRARKVRFMCLWFINFYKIIPFFSKY